jgi:hypothetical protein
MSKVVAATLAHGAQARGPGTGLRHMAQAHGPSTWPRHTAKHMAQARGPSTRPSTWLPEKSVFSPELKAIPIIPTSTGQKAIAAV